MKITGAVLSSLNNSQPYAKSQPLSLLEMNLEPPGPFEVLIRMEVSGICHSDLSVVNGSRPRPTPMLLGHESAGIVEQVGDKVTGLNIGDRVVSVFLPRCESCAECKTAGRLPCSSGSRTNNLGTLPSGKTRISANGEKIFHHLGVSSFATHAVIDQSSLVKVDKDVPASVAALLGCAVLTGGGAVKNAAGLEPGQDIAIVGLGGVGMAAILVAAGINHGTEGGVIGIDTNQEKLEFAQTLGATTTLTPEQAINENIKTLVVVEAVGHAKAFETAVNLTAPGGTTVTVGLPAPDAIACISPLGITSEARQIIGSYLGSSLPAKDIPEYAQLWREGKLPVEKLISSTLKLDEINKAFDELDGGRSIRQIITFA